MELKYTLENRNLPLWGLNSPPWPGLGQEPPPDIPVQAGEGGGLVGRGLQSSSGDVIPQGCCFGDRMSLLGSALNSDNSFKSLKVE